MGLTSSDTVSCGLQSFVYHLLRQPARWQQIRGEIDSAVKDGRCQSQVVTYEDASKLPYLEASIKEALRILAPVSSKFLAAWRPNRAFEMLTLFSSGPTSCCS